MAHVTFTDIDDAAVRSVTAPNTFLSSYQTQSTNVTAANLADEGLEERNLASGVATDGWARTEYDAGFTGAPIISAAFGTLTIGAVSFNLTSGGGWTVGQGYGVVRVRFKTIFRYAYGATPSQTLSIRLVYQEDGGATTVVPNSLRLHQGQQTVAAGPNNVANFEDNMKFAFLVPYTADGAAHTLNFVRVQIQTGAAGYYFSNTTFQAVRFVKAVA